MFARNLGMISLMLAIAFQPVWAKKKKKKAKVRSVPVQVVPAPEVLPLIPWPQTLEMESWMARPRVVNLVAQDQWGAEGDFMLKAWKAAGSKTQGRGWPIRFVRDLTLSAEAYRLKITPKNMVVHARTATGLFYAAQTMRQLLLARPGYVPILEIEDVPAKTWRGMHVDVSRHFYPVDSIKRFLDVMAQHKMNRFHWHLTDDQGWRIEIKSRPKLTEVGACRVPREEAWNERAPAAPGEVVQCEAPHGGFYTQDQVREVVEYAKSRHITIIPEIEFPGHARAAVAAYPEIGCTGEALTVATGNLWPVKDLFCPGRPAGLELMRDVVREVADLFPGPWMHLGGDEADLQQWAADSATQQLKRSLGLQTDLQLEQWYWDQAAQMALDAGKMPMGWDEVAERGANPRTLVTAWRSPEVAAQAVAAGHHTILALTAHTYFDYYQSKVKGEPQAFNGFLPLEQVYEMPLKVAGSDSAKGQILGAQGQLWSEHLKDFRQLGYMALPRMSALSEVVWTGEQRPGLNHFQTRLLQWVPELRNQGWHVVQHGLTPKIELSYEPGRVLARGVLPNLPRVPLQLECKFEPIQSGGVEQSAKRVGDCLAEPWVIEHSGQMILTTLLDGKAEGRTVHLDLDLHTLTGRKPVFGVEPSPKYNPNQSLGLVDGEWGTSQFSDGRWSGFEGAQLQMSWDVGALKEFKELKIGSLQDKSSWIFHPKSVELESSIDGVKWKSVGKLQRTDAEYQSQAGRKEWILVPSKRFNAQFLRLKIEAQGLCPEGHSGAGQNCWTFLDEVALR